MLSILNKKQRKYKAHMGTKTYIADMETDGVYFSDDQKQILQEQRDQLLCDYSGLPSLHSYMDNKNSNE